ncbi:MAG: hypothetical protein QM702_02435 [Rubrivivax sp.]
MDATLAVRIAEFEPSNGNWLELERLFERAFSDRDPTVYYSAIFNLFERFPDQDGSGVFWSALHGMEATGSYENELVRFFRRYPSEMTRTMLIRMRNAGDTKAAGVPIDLLIGTLK